MEYVTVAEVRDALGDAVVNVSDASLLRRIDRLSAELEDNLGHGFGRAVVVQSSAAESVVVTSTKVTIGGDDYTFATYDTLGELVDAINAAADTYSAELLPQVPPDTPSTLLKAKSSTVIGATYDKRQVLDITAWWLKVSGDGHSHIFLPLPLRSVTEIVENGTAVDSANYWAIQGENWVIRKQCSCSSSSTCQHPRGTWSTYYPGNITVEYIPLWWNTAPGTIKNVLMDALEDNLGLGPMQSETFVDYSYRRQTSAPIQWRDVLGGGSVRRYAIRFMP